METSLFNRLQATLLALATVGLLLLAVLNFQQESRFQQPDDGVWWAESHGGLVATKVLPDSAAQKAGIEKGDLLTAVNDVPIARVADLERELYLHTGVYGKANYAVTRDGQTFLSPGLQKVEPGDLAPKVKDLLSNRPSKLCYIKADARAKYSTVEDVVDNLRAGGVDELGLLTEEIPQNAKLPPPQAGGGL